MKVLWIPSWYPSQTYLRLANFTKRRAQAVSLFAETAVLHAVESLDDFTGIVAEQTPGSLLEVRVYYKNTTWRWLKLLRFLRASWRGWRYVQKNFGKPDLLQLSVIYPAGSFAWFLSLLYRIPLVSEEQWTGYRPADGSFKGFWLKTLAKCCTRRSKAVITISEGMAKDMTSHGLSGNYKVVPNTIEFFPGLLRQHREDRICRFIHASTLDERQKNISGLLRTIQKLAKYRPNFQLTLAGGTFGFAEFENLANQLGIASFTHFTGYLDRPTLRRQMCEADVFISFSNFEGGAPNVILEAMSVGLPIISTEIGGMDEWVTPETGILIDIGDEAALAEAMSRMIDTHQNYDPQKISRIIEERCSYEVIGKKFLAIYEEVLGCQPSASS